MLDKKIRNNIITIKSLFPNDTDWLLINSKSIFTSNEIIYNIFDDEWVKKYITLQLFLSKKFLKLPRVLNFIKNNPNEYEILINSIRKSAIKFRIKQYTRTVAKNTNNFERLTNLILKSFNTDENIDIIKNLTAEVFIEYFTDKFLENQSLNKLENTTQQFLTQLEINTLRNAIMPKNLTFSKIDPAKIDEFSDENIIYHTTNKQWLIRHFYSKAVNSNLCESADYINAFLMSKEYQSTIQSYQNQAMNFAVNICTVNPFGRININSKLPYEVSYKMLLSQVETTLSNTFNVNLDNINHKKLNKKVNNVCMACYLKNLQIKPYDSTCKNKEELSPIWPS